MKILIQTKNLSYDFYVPKVKKYQIFVICYFSLTFGWCFRTPESDPEVEIFVICYFFLTSGWFCMTPESDPEV